jgi:trimeric autotransporter adhesin
MKRGPAMRSGPCTSNVRYLSSLRLLTVAICLCPAAAQALDPTSTATGTGALANENGGYANTADGFNALTTTTTGNYNTASGAAALGSNTTGYQNTASGGFALSANTTGYFNVASGANALNFNTIGINNTASGFNALYGNTIGRNNVAVGASALLAINGSNNIALGFNAGKNTTSGNGNIYIGHTGRNGSENKVIRIGQRQTKTFVAGIAGVPLSGATVVVRSNGQLGVVASSARYKQDIKPLGGAAGDVAEKLKQLRPVSFRYKTEPQATHYGLIAEEVDKVMPELVVRDDQNQPESVQYLELIPLLLQERREQQARIATLERRLAALEAALTQSPQREAAMRQAEPR